MTSAIRDLLWRNRTPVVKEIPQGLELTGDVLCSGETYIVSREDMPELLVVTTVVVAGQFAVFKVRGTEKRLCVARRTPDGNLWDTPSGKRMHVWRYEEGIR